MLPQMVSSAAAVVAGVLYPAYATFKAIRTRRLSDYLHWMMYWAVFAPLICAEPLACCVLGSVPLYYDARLLLVLWLVSPTTRGAAYVYRRHLHPLLRRHERQIDSYAQLASEQTRSTLAALCAQALGAARELARRAADSLPNGPTALAAGSGSASAFSHAEDGNGDSLAPDATSRDPDLDSVDDDLVQLPRDEDAPKYRKKPRKRNSD